MVLHAIKREQFKHFQYNNLHDRWALSICYLMLTSLFSTMIFSYVLGWFMFGQINFNGAFKNCKFQTWFTFKIGVILFFHHVLCSLFSMKTMSTDTWNLFGSSLTRLLLKMHLNEENVMARGNERGESIRIS